VVEIGGDVQVFTHRDLAVVHAWLFGDAADSDRSRVVGEGQSPAPAACRSPRLDRSNLVVDLATGLPVGGADDVADGILLAVLPHVDHGGDVHVVEQDQPPPAQDGRNQARLPRLIILGFKGSQVQILSSRRVAVQVRALSINIGEGLSPLGDRVGREFLEPTSRGPQ